jgi:hypothetical protein
VNVGAIVSLVLGLVFLVVAAVLVLAARRKQTGWQRMLGSADRTIAELRSVADAVRADLAALPQAGASGGSVAEFVSVSGRAVAGPGGPLTSPVSGADCVWYRVQVERRTRRTRRTGENTHATDTTSETVSDHRSQVAFALDDDTGTLPVEPDRAREHSLELATEQVRSTMADPLAGLSISVGDFSVGTGGGDTTEITREWVIRTGSRITVAGTLTDKRGELALMSVPDVTLVISRLDHWELLAAEQKSQRAMMITAAVFGVLGIVGVVVGIVLFL